MMSLLSEMFYSLERMQVALEESFIDFCYQDIPYNLDFKDQKYQQIHFDWTYTIQS